MLVPILISFADGTPPTALAVKQCECLARWSCGFVVQPSSAIPEFPSRFIYAVKTLIAWNPFQLAKNAEIVQSELFGRGEGRSHAQEVHAVEFYKKVPDLTTFYFPHWKLKDGTELGGWKSIQRLAFKDIKAGGYRQKLRASIEFVSVARTLSKKIVEAPLPHILQGMYSDTPPGPHGSEEDPQSPREGNYADPGNSGERDEPFVTKSLSEALAFMARWPDERWEQVEIRVRR